MRFAYVVGTKFEPKWKIATQLGVSSAVISFHEENRENKDILSYENLKQLRDQLNDNGLDFSIVEGDLFPMEDIRLGLPSRDVLIKKYCDTIEILGELGVSTICYNFMAGVNWYRTRVDFPERGGALTTQFSYEDSKKNLINLPAGVELSEEKLWDNLYYFLDKILPVAEKAGVNMALHPDDPPISPLMGVPRILVSSDAFDRIFKDFPYKRNGLTFCQSNFALMKGNEDIYALAERYAKEGKIFFAHFRDVRGVAENFHETFHDNGPTDMVRLLKIYNSIPSLLVRPDHAPALEGEDNKNPGYEILGKIFAFGYMRGILDSIE